MKLRKVLSAIAATVVAISALAVSTAAAFTIDKDLKTGWSANATVPAEEFEGASTDSVFTITYTADLSLAEKEKHNYWCIKPHFADGAWIFANTFIGPELSELGDTYVIDPNATEFKFMLTAEDLERFQTGGMVFYGHGIKLETFSWSNDDTLPVASAGDVSAATDGSKGNPATGVEDVVGGTLVMLAAGGVMLLSGKRK